MNMMNILNNSGAVEEISITKMIEHPEWFVVRSVDNVWLVDTMTGDVFQDLGFICPECGSSEKGDEFSNFRINGKIRKICPACREKRFVE